MSISPREELQAASEATRSRFLASLTDGEAAALLHQWEGWQARPEQCEPSVPYSTWLIMTGRGFGKTRTGTEWIHKKVAAGHVRHGAFVHRTSGDLRDILIDGESGILATAPPGRMPKHEPSKRRVTFHNGAQFTCYSSEEPDQIRGPTLDLALGDEFASWRSLTGVDGATAFDNLRFAMRGKHNPHGPQLCLTTTPRRTKAIREIEAEALDPASRIVITRGSLRDNLANLDPGYVNLIMNRYAGTALGEQEIDGVIARAVEGAIFTEAAFNDHRITSLDELPELAVPIVAVDPSVGDGSADECGITVQALSAGPLPTEVAHGELTTLRQLKHGYVLADRSLSGSPDKWAGAVCEAAAEFGARIVVAEANQGGKLIPPLLRARNPALRVKTVHSIKGKELRAQPVSGLYEQGRWHHVGELTELEDQALSWVPGSGDSPDRLDALVHGALYLEGKGLNSGLVSYSGGGLNLAAKIS